MDNVSPERFNKGVAGTNPYDILLPTWAGEVLTSYDYFNVFESMVSQRSIVSGREIEFPVVGKISGQEVWDSGEALEGGGGPTNSFKISLDDRPMVSHFELDKIDLLVSQFEYRGEMARQCGQILARMRDSQIGALLVKAAQTAQSQAVLDDSGLDTSYGGSVITDAAFNVSTDSEAAALRVLKAIEDTRVGWENLDIDPNGSSVIVAPELFHAIRRLGVAETASDLSAGAGRPMFGGVAEAGGLGAGLTKGYRLDESLVYMDTKICKSNNMPTADRSGSGDANYRVDCSDTAALMFKPEAVASIRKLGVETTIWDDPRRNTTFVASQMFSGGGVMRPELAVQMKTS